MHTRKGDRATASGFRT